MMNRPDAAAPSPLDGGIRVATILVATIAMSVVILAVVGTVVAREANDPVPLTFLIGIVSAAFFALVGSVLYRRFSYHPLRLRQIYEASGERGLAGHMLRTTVVSAALAEAVAVFGLLMGIITGDTYYLYVLCAIALLGVLSNFPRARRWRELSSEITAQSQAGAPSTSLGIGGAR